MRRRLEEAADTGAKVLVTVCHGCQWIMDCPGTETSVEIVSYVRLVGEALGIRHEDRSRKLREIGNMESYLKATRQVIGEGFERLPFERERIREAVRSVLENAYWTPA